MLNIETSVPTTLATEQSNINFVVLSCQSLRNVFLVRANFEKRFERSLWAAPHTNGVRSRPMLSRCGNVGTGNAYGHCVADGAAGVRRGRRRPESTM